MSENRPFIQMCRMFLADRVKDNDVDGQLSKAFLEVRQSPIELECYMGLKFIL